MFPPLQSSLFFLNKLKNNLMFCVFLNTLEKYGWGRGGPGPLCWFDHLWIWRQRDRGQLTPGMRTGKSLWPPGFTQHSCLLRSIILCVGNSKHLNKPRPTTLSICRQIRWRKQAMFHKQKHKGESQISGHGHNNHKLALEPIFFFFFSSLERRSDREGTGREKKKPLFKISSLLSPWSITGRASTWAGGRKQQRCDHENVGRLTLAGLD